LPILISKVCRNEDDDHLYIGDAIVKGKKIDSIFNEQLYLFYLSIDACCLFHQCFLRAFFEQNFGAKNYTKLAYGSEILAPKILYEKRVCKTLMKLTPENMHRQGLI